MSLYELDLKSKRKGLRKGVEQAKIMSSEKTIREL